MKLIFKLIPILFNIVLSILIVRYTVEKFSISTYGIWGVLLSYRMIISIALLNMDNFLLLERLRKKKEYEISSSDILGLNLMYLFFEITIIFMVCFTYEIDIFSTFFIVCIGVFERTFINSSRGLIIEDKGKYIPVVEITSNLTYFSFLVFTESITLTSIAAGFFLSQFVKVLLSLYIIRDDIDIFVKPKINVKLLHDIFLSSGGAVLQLFRIRGLTSISIILLERLVSSESAAIWRILQRCPQVLGKSLDTFTSIYKNKLTQELESQKWLYTKFTLLLMLIMISFSFVNFYISELIFSLDIPEVYYLPSIFISLSFVALQCRKFIKIFLDFRGEFNALWKNSLIFVSMQYGLLLFFSTIYDGLNGFLISWVLILIIDVFFLLSYIKFFKKKEFCNEKY
ncbi:MAG: hypothetical protein COA59_07215 [Colwellia sp.]|nr:MAG: hypothetical protein COA59_07215 [Colwellia sp.]